MPELQVLHRDLAGTHALSHLDGASLAKSDAAEAARSARVMEDFLAAEDKALESLPIEEYQTLSELFTDDIYEAVNLETCVKSRVSEGGTSPESVKAQIRLLQESVLA